MVELGPADPGPAADRRRADLHPGRHGEALRFPRRDAAERRYRLLPFQIWFGGFLEVVGGALLALGLFTRPVAFLLSGEMAVAYFQFHAPGGFWPAVNGGTAAALYCFVWLYFSAAGAGPWSLDARLTKGTEIYRRSRGSREGVPASAGPMRPRRVTEALLESFEKARVLIGFSHTGPKRPRLVMLANASRRKGNRRAGARVAEEVDHRHVLGAALLLEEPGHPHPYAVEGFGFGPGSSAQPKETGLLVGS